MDKYGLIGYPLGHSFSVSYFNQKFADEGINAKYENFEIPTIDVLPEVLDKNPNLKGLNVTIPYKEKVIPFLDSISPDARAYARQEVAQEGLDSGNRRCFEGHQLRTEIFGTGNSLRQSLRAA